MAESPSTPARFPSTLWTDVLALRDDPSNRRREPMARLVERYWKPVYWAIRAQGGLDDATARDLTQDFFVEILDGRMISSVDPTKGTFRTYLKGSLRFFLMEARRRDRRVKRGGDREILSLDFDSAGEGPPDLGGSPEQDLDRAWAHQILRDAMAELERSLRDSGKSREANLFLAYEMSEENPKPTYEQVGRRFGATPTEVWNALRTCRRRLRDLLIDRIGAYVRNSDEVFDELRELFGP